MIDLTLFQRKLLDLMASMPLRDGSEPETQHRNETYYRRLRDLHPEDFVESCDRILFTDDWFPTIARIRDVARECAAGRQRRNVARAATVAQLACPHCHGSRWVRLGGFDPLNMHAGEVGSRVIPCGGCTTNGAYDMSKERALIARVGGHRLPDTEHRTAVPAGVQWPLWMDELRNPATGRIDMDKLYRKSRELRGLDPDIDERPARVAGWKSAGRVTEREMVPA